MKTKASVTVKNKIYPYTLERVRRGVVRLVSKDANIDQEFLSEDVSELLLDLPSLILAEKAHKESQSDVIRFRVSSKDKRRIEEKATRAGYSSLSGYIRDCALKS